MYPKFLEVEITGKCQYSCRHCYGSFPKPGELPLENVEKLVAEAQGLFDCIIFSGGEPFLHPDLVPMVEAASHHFLVFITTSGYPIGAQHIERLRNKAVFVFGLDGIGETHDRYRGVSRAFERLITVLDMTADLPKEIIVTLWRGVIPQIDQIIALGEKYNAIVHFNGVIPVGRAKDNREIFPDAQELEPVYEKLLHRKMKGGSVMTDLHKIHEKDKDEGIPVFCRGRYNVTPTGDLRPCEFHHAVLGNIHESRLSDIITRAKETELIKSREDGFKKYVAPELVNSFDYHTRICHKISCPG